MRNILSSMYAIYRIDRYFVYSIYLDVQLQYPNRHKTKFIHGTHSHSFQELSCPYFKFTMHFTFFKEHVNLIFDLSGQQIVCLIHLLGS